MRPQIGGLGTNQNSIRAVGLVVIPFPYGDGSKYQCVIEVSSNGGRAYKERRIKRYARHYSRGAGNLYPGLEEHLDRLPLQDRLRITIEGTIYGKTMINSDKC